MNYDNLIDFHETAVQISWINFFLDSGDLDEMKETLKKHFDEILEKIRDSIEKGKAVKEDLLVKVSSYNVPCTRKRCIKFF